MDFPPIEQGSSSTNSHSLADTIGMYFCLRTITLRFRTPTRMPSRGLLPRRTLVPGLIATMANGAGLVHQIELFCKPCCVVGSSQCSQPGGLVSVVGGSLLEPGAVSPNFGACLRIGRGLPLARSRWKHSRKSLGPLCEGRRRIALTLCLASRLHGITHRAEGDGGHIQARLPSRDGIDAGNAGRTLLGHAGRDENEHCAEQHNQVFGSHAESISCLPLPGLPGLTEWLLNDTLLSKAW